MAQVLARDKGDLGEKRVKKENLKELETGRCSHFGVECPGSALVSLWQTAKRPTRTYAQGSHGEYVQYRISGPSCLTTALPVGSQAAAQTEVLGRYNSSAGSRFATTKIFALVRAQNMLGTCFPCMSYSSAGGNINMILDGRQGIIPYSSV